MSSTRPCPRCGAPLAPSTPESACPSCLLRLGLDRESQFVRTGAGSPAPEPPTPAELAELFPQLELLETLGRGGMGVVYRARQRGLDRDVALKILLVRPEDRPAFAERFAREARALAQLSHPAIVGVHDFGVAGEHYYLTMEYVDGANLRQLMRSGELRPAQALDVIGQVCEALQFAHEEGVVHRDIKPENILVDRRGRVKIADFGLAKMVRQPGGEPLTGTFQAMGTPHYMAPEQIEHPLDVDHRADIYSLGVVFYELLTGELPMGAFDPPSKKARVDVRLDDVVLKAMRKEPERRYQHASEVGTDVSAISASAGEPSPDWEAHHAERRDARRALHRKRGGMPRWVWGLGCFGVCLLGIPVLLFLGGAMLLGARYEATAKPIVATIEPSPEPALSPVHGANCEDIDAVELLSVSQERLGRLGILARRANLTAHEQQHLAHVVLEQPGPTDVQADVLIELLRAQPADGEVRSYVTKALTRMPDTTQRARVLYELDQRADSPDDADVAQ